MRTRSYHHLSAEELEALSLGLAASQSVQWLAMVWGRAPRTVSREMARNAGRKLYRACTAHKLTSAGARQPRRLQKLRDP